jgi:hypothetical protein
MSSSIWHVWGTVEPDDQSSDVVPRRLLRQRWTDCLQRKGRARCFHFLPGALCRLRGWNRIGECAGSCRKAIQCSRIPTSISGLSPSSGTSHLLSLRLSRPLPRLVRQRCGVGVLRTEGGAAAGGGPRAATSSLVTVAASCGSTAAGSWRLRRSSESSAHASASWVVCRLAPVGDPRCSQVLLTGGRWDRAP